MDLTRICRMQLSCKSIKLCVICSKKVNRKVEEEQEPQAEATANPGHQEEEKIKVTQINVCLANKQMHD